MSIGKSFLWVNAAEIIFFLSSYIIHGTLGRTLGPADYGRCSIIIALVTATIVFLGDGIPKALSRYSSAFPEKSNAIFRKALKLQSIIVLIIFGIYFLSAPYIAAFLRDPTLTPLLKLSAFIIPAFAAASFMTHYFNGQRLFKLQARIKLARSIIRVTIIPLSALYFGLTGVISGYILVPLVVISYSFPLYLKTRNKEVKKDFPAKTLLRFAVPIMFFMLFYETLINIDVFLVKRILGSDELTGIYNASLLIGRSSFYLLSALALILLPTISHTLEKKGKEAAFKMMEKTFKYLWFILAAFIFIWPVWTPYIVELLFSSKFIDETLFARILALGLPFLTIFYILAFTLNGSGQVKKVAMFTTLGAVTNTVLNLILIPRYGLMGAALATASTSVVMGITMLLLSFKIIGRYLSFKVMFIPLISMLILSIPSLLMLCMDISIYLIFPYTIFAGLVYLLILIRSKQLDLQEFFALFHRKKA